jgi:hypothetical protein
MNDKPTPEQIEAIRAAFAGETPAIICATKCEPCMYGSHYGTPAPHPWAGPEDIAHAVANGRPEPTGNCGCWCARPQDGAA